MSVRIGRFFGMMSIALPAAVGAQAPQQEVTSSAADAPSETARPVFFVGLRLWAIEWDVFSLGRIPVIDPANPGVVLLKDDQRERVSDLTIAPIPLIGLRYGNLVATASYMPATSFDAGDAFRKDVERDEFDITIGYHIMPALALSVAYKEATVSKLTELVGDSELKIRGVLFGISGTAPLSPEWSLYGNLAYGITRQKSEFADAAGETDFSGNYKIGEIGMSYRLGGNNRTSLLKAVTTSIGYRAQVYTAEGLTFGTYLLSAPTTPVAVEKRDSRSTTSGFVLGVVGVF